MSQFRIGRSMETGNNVHFPVNISDTHLHLIGATGTGKTTAIKRISIQRMLWSQPPATMFVIDPLGGLADALVDFIAHPTLCTDAVRDRLVYIEPAATDYVMPFNSLRFSDEDDLYYRTGRTSDCMLRSGRDHDMTTMLRLRRWLYNCFYSIATLGYPPAAAQFLLCPGTDQHNQLISQIPQRLQLDWAELLGAGPRERITMLDSTRNRLNPFFACPILNRMLSNLESYFDVERFIRKKKIVIVNLAPKGRIDPHIANTIGGLMLNEIIQTARNMPRDLVRPTLTILDEFQNFVGEDLYRALPETRQIGLELLLSHQSFAQLEQGEVDMRGIVWQARSRAIFCNDAEDADLLAHELASQNYNSKELKDQIEVFRQKKVGQELARLRNFSATNTSSHAVDQNSSRATNRSRSRQGLFGSVNDVAYTDGETVNRGKSEKDATSNGTSDGWSETLIDRLEDFYEVSSRTYYTFDEQMRRWARFVRRLKTGQALFKFRDDDRLHHVDIDPVVIPMTSLLADCRAALLEKNFSNPQLFIPKSVVEDRWLMFVEQLGNGQLIPPHQQALLEAVQREENQDDSLFR